MQCPFLLRHYPLSSVLRHCPTPCRRLTNSLYYRLFCHTCSRKIIQGLPGCHFISMCYMLRSSTPRCYDSLAFSVIIILSSSKGKESTILIQTFSGLLSFNLLAFGLQPNCLRLALPVTVTSPKTRYE